MSTPTTGSDMSEPQQPDLDEPPVAAPAPASRSQQVAHWAVIGMTVAVIGGCSIAIVRGGDDAESSSAMAAVMCESFVKDALKAPSTADFPPTMEYSISGGPTTWNVAGYVDSENSFGAMIRTGWECQVRAGDDDSWTLVDLDAS